MDGSVDCAAGGNAGAWAEQTADMLLRDREIAAFAAAEGAQLAAVCAAALDRRIAVTVVLNALDDVARQCGAEGAAMAAAAFLDELQVTPPYVAGSRAEVKAQAAHWAAVAEPRELEEFTAAGLQALGRRLFAVPARARLGAEMMESLPLPGTRAADAALAGVAGQLKRGLVAAWQRLSAEDRRAFLARVDPDGRFRS